MSKREFSSLAIKLVGVYIDPIQKNFLTTHHMKRHENL